MIDIVAFGCTHGYHRLIELPKLSGDLLICTGDIQWGEDPPFGFLQWFGQIGFFGCRILVPGNHDRSIEQDPVLWRTEAMGRGVHLLIDQSIEFRGIKIHGSPWTPEFMGWHFMKEDEDLVPHWGAIPDDTHVLVTHGPPRGVLDWSTFGNVNCGSRTLLDRVRNLDRLRLHVFSHIHESYGTILQDGVEYHNVSIAGARTMTPGLDHRPHHIQIDRSEL